MTSTEREEAQKRERQQENAENIFKQAVEK